MPHETAKEKKEINPNPKCPNKKANLIPHKRAKTEMETFRKLFVFIMPCKTCLAISAKIFAELIPLLVALGPTWALSV